MSKVAIEGNASGSGTLTIAAPNTNSNFTLSLPTNTGTIITQNSTPAFASTIGVGGATAAASGAGITFPGTVSASSDANTLDDYEEGTWTPGFKFSIPGTSSISFGAQTGRYTKIGSMVYASFALIFDLTKGTAAGDASITGLPFAPTIAEDFYTGCIGFQDNMSTDMIGLLQRATNTEMYIGKNSGSTMAISNFSDGSGQQIRATMIYAV
jgi:hypothetical protein